MHSASLRGAVLTETKKLPAGILRTALRGTR